MDGAGMVNTVTSVMPLRNVMLLTELIERVRQRDPDLPGMACFSGPSGLGKTVAAAWNANEYDCYHVEVKESWSRKKFVAKIVESMGMPPSGTIGDMVDQIGEELAKSRRPLLLDEAHLLAKPGLIGIVRDIYESSIGGTVILIGEEMLPQTLARWERVHNRMLDWVQAQPCDLREMSLLAQLKCPGLEIDREVLEHLLELSQARARRIVVNLNVLSENMMRAGKTTVAKSDIKDIRFFTGEAPRPRGNI
ncbi:ATP-binding protein [Ponticoccus gilvus]|nr:ATP-binding protein [Enemella evansiae]